MQTPPVGLGDQAISLFVALELPALLRQQLEPLKKALPGHQWVFAQHPHLVLRDIDAIPPDRLPLIRQALRSVQLPGFTLRLKSLRRIEHDRKNLLLATLATTGALYDLRAYVDDALKRRAGLELKRDRFLPHIDLAWCDAFPGDAACATFDGKSLLHLEAFAVAHFTLFARAAGPSSAPRALEEFFLN